MDGSLTMLLDCILPEMRPQNVYKQVTMPDG